MTTHTALASTLTARRGHLVGASGTGINLALGILYAWGVGGFVLSRLSQMLKARSGDFSSSFVSAGLLLVLGAGLALLIRPAPPRTAA